MSIYNKTFARKYLEGKFFFPNNLEPHTDGRDIFDNDATRQQQLQSSYQHGKNPKLSISEHREQYYQTVRKPSAQSPGLDSALERIPEYSEDIYPYATFHLKDQDKSGTTRQAQGLIYESRETMLMSKKHRSSSGGVNLGGTGQRPRKKSKKFNTESEEYDSLNSDSDTVSRELDATSRTESSNCLDDPGPVNFSSKFSGEKHFPKIIVIGFLLGRAYSPGPRKERLALLQRPPAHHSKLVYFPGKTVHRLRRYSFIRIYHIVFFITPVPCHKLRD